LPPALAQSALSRQLVAQVVHELQMPPVAPFSIQWQAGAGRCDGSGPPVIRKLEAEAGATRVRRPARTDHGSQAWSAFAEPAPVFFFCCRARTLWLSSAHCACLGDRTITGHYGMNLAKEQSQEQLWNASPRAQCLPMPAFLRPQQELTASADSMERPNSWLLSINISFHGLHGRYACYASTKRWFLIRKARKCSLIDESG